MANVEFRIALPKFTTKGARNATFVVVFCQ